MHSVSQREGEGCPLQAKEMDRWGIKLTSRDGSGMTSPQPSPKETVLHFNTFLSLKME